LAHFVRRLFRLGACSARAVSALAVLSHGRLRRNSPASAILEEEWEGRPVSKACTYDAASFVPRSCPLPPRSAGLAPREAMSVRHFRHRAESRERDARADGPDSACCT